MLLKLVSMFEGWTSLHHSSQTVQSADQGQPLTSDIVLKYFDVKRPILVTVDASMQGLGAALLQDGGVIAYTSHALVQTKECYAQIEKEVLVVVFVCARFHNLIYGKSDVTIKSDHKPLEVIMEKLIYKGLMRIQWMLLKLQPYYFKLIHVRIRLADCLSRLSQDN